MIWEIAVHVLVGIVGFAFGVWLVFWASQFVGPKF